jgi:hypothetical protein
MPENINFNNHEKLKLHSFPSEFIWSQSLQNKTKQRQIKPIVRIQRFHSCMAGCFILLESWLCILNNGFPAFGWRGLALFLTAYRSKKTFRSLQIKVIYSLENSDLRPRRLEYSKLVVCSLSRKDDCSYYILKSFTQCQLCLLCCRLKRHLELEPWLYQSWVDSCCPISCSRVRTSLVFPVYTKTL